jgi:hypothetical protein
MNRINMQTTWWRTLVRGLVLCVVLGLAFILVSSVIGAPSGANKQGSALDSPLIVSTPTLTGPQFSATKEAMFTGIQETRQAVLLTPLPASAEARRKVPATYVPIPGPATYSPVPGSTPAGAGAIAQLPPVYSGNMFHIENGWYMDTDSGTTRTSVYAGSSSPAGFISDQGVVIVWQVELVTQNGQRGERIVSTNVYPTPIQAGSVHVINAQGTRLILQSSKGTMFYFDLPSRQYVSSLDTVVATATP